MEIIVNGCRVEVKKSLQIEYVVENPDFEDSGEYTFAIQIPIKDCHNNRMIFGDTSRADAEIDTIEYECRIVSGKFIKDGVLVIKKATESELECQFLAGRSVLNYKTDLDEIYINELSIGNAYTYGSRVVSLPWVNNESGNLMNAPIEFSPGDNWHVGGMSGVHQSAVPGHGTYMPFLIDVAKRICEEIGFSHDFMEWETSINTYLLVCNSLPYAWGISEMARVLPHWSVKEFFLEVGRLLNGRFDFDFIGQKVKFSYRSEISAAPVVLSDVLEEHSIEISDDEVEHDDINMLAYADRDDEQWKLLCCDWYIKTCEESHVKNFSTLSSLMTYARANMSYETGSRPGELAQDRNKLLYAEDVDTYFVLKRVSKEVVRPGTVRYNCRLEAVNIYGAARFRDEEDKAHKTELKIVPVRIDFTDEDNGYCMFLSPGSYSEDYTVEDDADDTVRQIGAIKGILKGKQGDKPEYYSRIYVAFWTGTSAQSEGLRLPYTDYINFNKDHTEAVFVGGYNLRLNSANREIFRIYPKEKYEFKFLCDEIPDTKAVFIIKGKAYICKKITASISQEVGLSKLMKGEFYRIRESRLIL